MKEISDITISDIIAVIKTDMKKGFSYYNENRKSCAFAIKLEGKTSYYQDGIKTVSDPSHITVLPYGASYKFAVEEIGECILFEVRFENDIYPFDKITSLPIISSGNVHLAAMKAERVWTYKKQGFRHKCIGYLYDILSYTSTDEGVYINSEKYSIIEPSIRYIEEKLSDPNINTEMLASLSGISVPYFRKLFYEIYKMPVAKYIEFIRMSKARDLLKTDGISVGYVAESVGYRNIYHFSKAFKKITGTSPSFYIRNGL